MTAVLIEHFKHGAYYPTGGSSTLASSIVPVIIAAGGMALVRAPVDHIIMNEDHTKALGVHVRSVWSYLPLPHRTCLWCTYYTPLHPSHPLSTFPS
jgi:hypothetical protein